MYQIMKVANYLSLSYLQAESLDIYTFRLALKQADIMNLTKTKEGLEIIKENCRYLTTDFDIDGLRQLESMLKGGK